jgi:hypothetical protein
MDNLVNDYLALVEKALKTSAAEDVAAVEFFEEMHPEVVDASYKAGGPYTYDPVSGTVYSAA